MTGRGKSSRSGKNRHADRMEVDEEEQTPEESNTEEGEDEEDDYEFKWLDKGKRRNGRIEYDSVLLTLHETSFRVSKSDFVLLWGIHGDETEADKEPDADQTIEEIWQSAGCAKVEAMWEEPADEEDGRTKAMFQARWFFQKHDLDRVISKEDLTGSISLDSLKKRMRPREVVGSMEVGVYVMNTIGGPARVFFRTVQEDGENILGEGDEPQLPKDAFMCRYSLKKAEQNKEDSSDKDETDKDKNVLMEVVPYAPEEDTTEEDENDEDDDDKSGRKRRRGSDKDNDTVDEEEESSAGSSSDEESRVAAPEGEGSIVNQGKIRVGPQHQVPVPVFDPEAKAPIVSRNPILVWSPDKTPSQEVLDDYFRKAADILVPFAEQQMLVMGTEPFTSIPSGQMEDLMRERELNVPMTVSSFSTSAALAALALKKPLLRECDADALLKNLHDQNYSVEAAIGMISASPRDFLTKWTATERENFDSSFRRHGGSLRMVAKAMASLASDKTHCQVVDYHFRFKIPDQFRRYQDKKREQAVRMMECIEARRDNNDAHIVPQGQGSNAGDSGPSAAAEEPRKKAKTDSWSETGTGDVTKAVEERRSAAKQLLLDIQRNMGKDKMAEVAGAVISLNQGSERESKEALMRILKNEPHLHQRLVEFLPRRFWK